MSPSHSAHRSEVSEERSPREPPILGMEPALKPAAQETETKVVGVIATQATP